MKKKSILYIITRADVVGGASIHLIDLIRHAHNTGYKVHVAIGGSGEFSDYLQESEPCEVHCVISLKRELSLVYDMHAIKEIRQLIQALSPSLIHLHSAKAGLVGRLASIGLGVPRVFTVHGWPFTDGIPTFSRWLYLGIEWVMSWLPTYVITVSEKDKRLAKQNYFANMTKMRAIQNGVSPTEGVSIVQAIQPTDNLRFVMVARFDKPKCQEAVLEALSLCDSKKLSIDFVGEGPSIERCRLQASALGIADRVRFHGYLESHDVRSILLESHAFLLISNWEGLPLTIIEAMSASLPVIASDVGGVSELVEDQVTGVLIPRHGRVERLAQVFDFYCEHPHVLKTHGERGLSAYNQHFTLDVMLNKTFDVYDEACK